MTDEAKIKVRVSCSDSHYGGGLVDGAYLLRLFGDVATELLIKKDGDEGLLRAYSNVEFLAPVYAGDFIEVKGHITKVSRTSREIEFRAYKVARLLGMAGRPSSGEVVAEPILVAKATGVCVVLKERQRFTQEA